MNTVERPGINEKWTKDWRRTANQHVKYAQGIGAKAIADLEFYVAHGEYKMYADLRANPVKDVYGWLAPKHPERKDWEAQDTDLSCYARMRLGEFENEGMDRQRWDPYLAKSAFSAKYLSQMIVLHTHMLATPRFGVPMQMMNFLDIPFTALGFVIGLQEEASRLARMQFSAFRKQYFNPRLNRPISIFMARILADYLGEPLPALADYDDTMIKEMKLPVNIHLPYVPASLVLRELFDIWRTPEASVLIQPCLSVCDIHTHHSQAGSRCFHFEFNYGAWTRIPIELLLIFRLRESLGLDNPQVDHPLMDSVLGKLPPLNADSIPDELLVKVRTRMEQDNYDEQKIWAEYLG